LVSLGYARKEGVNMGFLTNSFLKMSIYSLFKIQERKGLFSFVDLQKNIFSQHLTYYHIPFYKYDYCSMFISHCVLNNVKQKVYTQK